MTTIGSCSSCSSASDYTYAALARESVGCTRQTNAQQVQEREHLGQQQASRSDPYRIIDILA